MSSLYNEIAPYPARWLENLVAANEIAPGVVVEDSIAVLPASLVEGFKQFHTFAGIGIWSRALREAGWPDDAEVWTGSCPCQPFSSAGRKKGFSDDRHLWPAWYALIKQCRPPVIFGEQVASPDGLAWFGTVRADLEAAGYSVGCADLCAAGVGAPHIRQRLYFVAVANGERLERLRVQLLTRRPQPAGAVSRAAPTSFSAGRLADTIKDDGPGRFAETHGRPTIESDRHRTTDSDTERLVDASRSGSRGDTGTVSGAQGESSVQRQSTRYLVDVPVATSAQLVRGWWAENGVEWVACQDGKARPVEPGLEPLVNANTSGLGRTRSKRVAAYGNAIVLPLAVTFVSSVIDLLVNE